MEVLPYCRSKMYLVRMWGSHHACFPFFLWLTHKQVWMRFMNQAWKLVLFMSVCAQEHWEQCIIDLEGITAKFKSGGVFTFYLSSAGVSQRLGMPRDSTWCAATLCFLFIVNRMTCHTWAEEKKQGKERENLRGDKERGEGGLKERLMDREENREEKKATQTSLLLTAWMDTDTRKEDRGGNEIGVRKWKIRRWMCVKDEGTLVGFSVAQL